MSPQGIRDMATLSMEYITEIVWYRTDKHVDFCLPLLD
jgi:hypothetical protein